MLVKVINIIVFKIYFLIYMQLDSVKMEAYFIRNWPQKFFLYASEENNNITKHDRKWKGEWVKTTTIIVNKSNLVSFHKQVDAAVSHWSLCKKACNSIILVHMVWMPSAQSIMWFLWMLSLVEAKTTTPQFFLYTWSSAVFFLTSL